MEEELKTLLERLDVMRWYPGQLHMKDILQVDTTLLSRSQPPVEQELASIYLQKLLTLDYRARHIVAEKHATAIKRVTSESEVTFDDFFGEMGENVNSCDQIQSEFRPIHPMDLQMAILSCSDDFVKRYLFTKLATCHYALPIVVPSPRDSTPQFNLWCCRDIKVLIPQTTAYTSSRGEESNNKMCKPQFSLCGVEQAKVPLVSFIRLSSSAVSKSQLLNLILNGKKHHTFFNRNSVGSSEHPQFMKGVIEITWYCPSGKEGDVFDRCIAFTNLRGNALDHPQQIKFLDKISTMNVVLMSESERNIPEVRQLLTQYLGSSKPLIVMQTDQQKQRGTSQALRDKVKIPLMNRNEADLAQEIAKEITRLITPVETFSSLEDSVKVALEMGFVVDEEQGECKQLKMEADRMRNLLISSDINLSALKTKFLPLQGKLWHDWCAEDKSLTRLTDKDSKNIEEHKSTIEEKKKSIRLLQYNEAKKGNDFITLFIQNIRSPDESKRMYFIKWIRQFLDDLFSEKLAQLQLDYHREWSQNIGAVTDLIPDPHRQLDDVIEEIEKNTFGIEHIFRELGQIYEATESHTYKVCDRKALPHVAAELLIQGYPVELMDGDAVYVPVSWISAVLTDIAEMLDDAKIFVLSILGLQSSGKSTLLNALFGLQFAVSAGRCTRGAFMQLVAVGKNMREQLQFDYVLIVDTEGLRSTELTHKASVNRDNELATFVIGLANLTAINIFGENPADMQDILQISVQAIMRMKQVNLQPSCVFVHQNVGAIDAVDKNLEARRNLQRRLDDMTKVAAQQEQCSAARFNDVIAFDINTQTFYFAHLWEGNPPMAPPNPAYGLNIQELKMYLFSENLKASHERCLTVSEFRTRVVDLWTALRCENFVFNFRNSLEIAEYNKLDLKFDEWSWNLRNSAMKAADDVKSKIRSGEKLTEVSIHTYILKAVQKDYESMLGKLNEFFEEERSKKIRIQWKCSTETRYETLKNDLIKRCLETCIDIFHVTDNKRSIDERKMDYERDMVLRSKQLAETLKRKASDENAMNSSFEKLWAKMIDKVKSTSPLADRSNKVEEDIEHVLLEQFLEQCTYSEAAILRYRSEPRQPFVVDAKIHIEQPPRYSDPNDYMSDVDCYKSQIISDLVERIDAKVSSYVANKQDRAHDVDYNIDYVVEIVRSVRDEVERFNSQDACRREFKAKKECVRDIATYVCYRAVGGLKRVHKTFLEANCPVAYLEGKRYQYYATFKKYCEGSSDVAVFTEWIQYELQKAVREAVYRNTGRTLRDLMKGQVPDFKLNRASLEHSILKELAMEGSFRKFMLYIHHPQAAFKEHIKKRAVEFCERSCRMADVARNELKTIMSSVRDAESAATKQALSDHGNISSWLEIFVKKSSEANVAIAGKPSVCVRPDEKLDFEYLSELMRPTIDKVESSLKDELGSISLVNLNDEDRPQTLLFEHFRCCLEQCPFCSALCVDITSGHEKHCSAFHLPLAVSGVNYTGRGYFCIDMCTSLINSERSFTVDDGASQSQVVKYKEYVKAGPKYAQWTIKHDPSEQKYWKWFVCQFKTDLEKHYGYKFEQEGTIPAAWFNYTKEEAIASIK